MNPMMLALVRVLGVIALSCALVAGTYFFFLADTEREIRELDQTARQRERELRELQHIAQNLNEYRRACDTIPDDTAFNAQLGSIVMAVHQGGAAATFLLSGRCDQCAPDALAKVLREKFRTAELVAVPPAAGGRRFLIRLRR